MKKITLLYDHFVFLSAYLRNLELSLARSHQDNFIDIKQYYKNFISPDVVAKLLKGNSSAILVRSKIDIGQGYELPSLAKRVFYRFCPSKNIDQHDLNFCYNLLLRTQEMLSSDIREYSIEVARLWSAAGSFNRCILRFKLKRKDFDKILRVEHYLENVNTTSMTVFKRDIKLLPNSTV